MMKKSLTQLLVLLIFLDIPLAEQRDTEEEKHPAFSFPSFHVFSNGNHSHHYHRHSPDTQLKTFSSTLVVLSGVLCFVAASLSSAGGIGGGGLFIPILAVVAGFDLKTASSFSAFMVMGVPVANVVRNFMFVKSPESRGRCLIDYDIVLLSEPCMLLGVSVGVICNRIFPEWLIAILFATFLAWSTFKTCRNGIRCWRLESEKAKLSEEYENEAENALLSTEETCKVSFPWVKLGILVLVWFSYFIVYLLRGYRNSRGIAALEPCGLGYWMVSSLQIPLAMVFTGWILLRKGILQYRDPSGQDMSSLKMIGSSNKLLFPTMALLAGLLGGVFGIGGGMLISPLLLQIGIAPEVTAATCSFMVFFSSTMSALQYLLLGVDHIYTALVFSLICFVGSLVGLMVVQGAIKEFGRASLIVFSVSIVMALSTVLITGFAAVNIWNDYVSEEYMGFKSPC